MKDFICGYKEGYEAGLKRSLDFFHKVSTTGYCKHEFNKALDDEQAMIPRLDIAAVVRCYELKQLHNDKLIQHTVELERRIEALEGKGE